MAISVPSLAFKRRQQLAKPPGTKGDPRKRNLWAIRTFDGTRTILNGDLSLEHLLYTEGDPSVRSARYPVDADAEPLGGPDFSFDAIVTCVNGGIECRHVRARAMDPSSARDASRLQAYREAAKRLGGSYVEITAATLDHAQQRIYNWSRLLAAHRRCAQHPLEALVWQLRTHLMQVGKCTFGQILEWHLHESDALVVAAFAQLLRTREISSDLDDQMWSRHTRVWVT